MPFVDLLNIAAKLGGLAFLATLVTIGVIVISITQGFNIIGRAAEEDSF